jgi:hypothetical protein
MVGFTFIICEEQLMNLADLIICMVTSDSGIE